MFRRSIAMLLCICMVLSMVPLSALGAMAEDPAVPAETVAATEETTVPEEETTAPVEESTEAAEETNILAEPEEATVPSDPEDTTAPSDPEETAAAAEETVGSDERKETESFTVPVCDNPIILKPNVSSGLEGSGSSLSASEYTEHIINEHLSGIMYNDTPGFEITVPQDGRLYLNLESTSSHVFIIMYIKNGSRITEDSCIRHYPDDETYGYDYSFELGAGKYIAYIVHDVYYGGVAYWSLDVDLYVKKHVHSWVTKKVAPTCTSQGYTLKYCTGCNESSKSNYVDKLPHTKVKAGKIPATCIETGRTAGTYCSVCNTVLSGMETIPKTDHTFKEYICTYCGLMGGTCGDHLQWRLKDDGKLTITGTGDMYDYENYGTPWGSVSDEITSVSLPDGLTSIGEFAFEHTNITAITIPDSVTSIGDSAFYSCKKLVQVTIPDTVTDMEEFVFSFCEALTTVKLPKNLKNLPAGTFFWCYGLTSVTIPDGVTFIGSSAFNDCTSLTNVVIPAAVTSIGERAFSGCRSLTEICITGDAPAIDSSAFKYITATVHYNEAASGWDTVAGNMYGGTITWGGEHTYKTTIVAPTCTEQGYTLHACICGAGYKDSYVDPRHNIVNEICKNCGIAGTCGTGLTWAYDEPSKTLTVKGTGTMKNYDSYDDAPWYKLNTVHAVFSEGVKTIGNHAFDNSELQTVVFPKSLYYLGEYAFWGADFREVTIPSSVTGGGEQTFGGCRQLEKVIIDCPRTLDYMFSYCYNLKDVQFTNNVKTIGAGTFWQCGSLKEIVLPPSLTRIEYVCQNQPYPDGTYVGSVFNGCRSLVSVTIPEGVTYIGGNAFEDCTSLETIMIPSTVTSVESHLFDGCTKLKAIYFQGPVSTSMTFYKMDATAYYPAAYASSWENAIKFKKWDTCLTWVKYSPCKQHIYGEWEINKAPTCTDTGLEISKCSACMVQKSRIVKATGHSLDEGKIIQEPTCTVAGNKTCVCTVCHTSVQVTIPALGHKKSPVVTENKITETCTTGGSYDLAEYCSVCKVELSRQRITVSALGHIEIIDKAEDPTCTENGVTQGKHCDRCGKVMIAQNTIDPLGHIEIIDEGFAETCYEDGLTEGKHCDRCSEVLIKQEVIPTPGHICEANGDGLICTVCLEELYLQIDEKQIDLISGKQHKLSFAAASDKLAGNVQWTTDNSDVIEVKNGTVIARNTGTAYAIATVKDGGITLTDRCRVDVTTALDVKGVQLSAAKATSELYSTAYTELDVLLMLEQNMDSSATNAGSQIPDSNSVAIESAVFKDAATAKLFGLVALDDRRIAIVPTDYAIKNSREVKGSYKSEVIVTVEGKEYTSEILTLTVKKSMPKLKVTVPAFNSFYSGQEQDLVITGGTVTEIEAVTLPEWLTLKGETLSLNEKAPVKSASGKATLKVYTEEWRIPAEISLTVKNTYKAATLKLSASTVTLNTAVADKVTVNLTANPADFDISKPSFRLTDSTGKVDKSGELLYGYSDGKITVEKTDATKGNYKLYISVGKTREIALNIKTISKTPTVSFKVSGSPDLKIPTQRAVITPAFKNYSGDFTIDTVTAVNSKKADATAQFTAKQDGKTISVTCKDDTAVGTYTLTLRLKLADGSFATGTAKVSVKKTTLKLKLNASKLTLNKLVRDIGEIGVSCTTKGYDFTKPVWALMDKSGKNPADGELGIQWRDGKLVIATNDATDYGATYKLLVKATEADSAVTLTITIPAENKSAVTATLKAKGSIDVIRDGSAVILTPTYKNVTAQTVKESKLVFTKTANKVTTNADELFSYTANDDGTFTITKAEGAKLDHFAKYTVQLVATVNGQPVTVKPIALSVKQGSAKLTLTTLKGTMFAMDNQSRGEFIISAADATLNGIAKVEIKDAKYADLFTIYDYEGGTYAIGYKDNKVPTALVGKTVTLNLNVFLKGNETAKANTTAKLKLTIIK